MSDSSLRIAVVGGGIIGLACAWRLARDGHRVYVFDGAHEAREASWAAAGMLAPHNEAEEPGPLHVLGTESLERWPAFLSALDVDHGLVDFREHGSLIPIIDEIDEREVLRKQDYLSIAGIENHLLSRAEVLDQERSLTTAVKGALWLPAAQVNPRAVTQVLRERCAEAGVSLRYGIAVAGIAGGVVRPRFGSEVQVDRVVLASGAWTPHLATLVGLDLPGEPVKGQMALLGGADHLLKHFVHCRHAYCVPRAGSGVVIGSTMVRSGFDRSDDPDAVDDLVAGARRLFPALKRHELSESWTGLRPRLRGGLPMVAAIDGVIVATGHFRNGVLLTPITAELVADIVAERPSTIDRSPFDGRALDDEDTV
ncbi:MAG: glycine oxidase ThiO [Planctomycetota bacterium]|jgi:glycine oxidase|nr:glycine oxidase ThiO [Planctomycetota bacterium]